jgi:REP element-mobilizing transposase RayT
MMAEKFRNRYRSRTIRLFGYDYSRAGTYFITVCTRKKIQYFGTIKNGKMILSDSGIIVQNCWLEIPFHFANVSLDEFVIMPDHVHGILILKSNLHCTPVETPNLGVSFIKKYLGVSFIKKYLGVSFINCIWTTQQKYKRLSLHIIPLSTLY